MYLAFSENGTNRKHLTNVVNECLKQLPEILMVLEKLGTENGFEVMILGATKSLLGKCQDIKEELTNNNFDLESWSRESWYLIDLCKPFLKI